MASSYPSNQPFDMLKRWCGCCGERAVAQCGCPGGDKRFIGAGKIADWAIKQHPEMNSVLIGEKYGIGEATVRRARQKSHSSNDESETRRTKDGKNHPTTKKRKPKSEDKYIDQANELRRELVGFYDKFERKFLKWQESAGNLPQEAKETLSSAFAACMAGLEDLERLTLGLGEKERTCPNSGP